MKAIFYKVYNLIRSPKKEWEVIKNEALDLRSIRNKFFLPLLGVLLVCVIIGFFIDYELSMIDTFGEFFKDCIKKSVIVFTSYFAGFFLSVILLNEFISHKKLGMSRDFLVCARFLAYTSSLMICIKSIVALFPDLFVLYAFNLYSAYIIWEGTPVIFPKLEDNNRGYFTVGALVLLYLSPLIIEKTMTFMMK